MRRRWLRCLLLILALLATTVNPGLAQQELRGLHLSTGTTVIYERPGVMLITEEEFLATLFIFRTTSRFLERSQNIEQNSEALDQEALEICTD